MPPMRGLFIAVSEAEDRLLLKKATDELQAYRCAIIKIAHRDRDGRRTENVRLQPAQEVSRAAGIVSAGDAGDPFARRNQRHDPPVGGRNERIDVGDGRFVDVGGEGVVGEVWVRQKAVKLVDPQACVGLQASLRIERGGEAGGQSRVVRVGQFVDISHDPAPRARCRVEHAEPIEWAACSGRRARLQPLIEFVKVADDGIVVLDDLVVEIARRGPDRP